MGEIGLEKLREGLDEFNTRLEVDGEGACHAVLPGGERVLVLTEGERVSEDVLYRLCGKMVPYSGGKTAGDIYSDISALSSMEKMTHGAFVVFGVGVIFFLLSKTVAITGLAVADVLGENVGAKVVISIMLLVAGIFAFRIFKK